MSSDRPDPDLGMTRQLQIDAVCVQYEQQLRARKWPRIEVLLQGHDEPLRSQLLRHLLQVELEYRNEHGEKFDVGEYLDRFPHDHSLIHIVQDEFSRASRASETELLGNSPAADKPGDSALSRSDSSLHGRFLPGTKIAGRYRIVSLLGKGGMGEVYRADDLRLGHTVALKFLPKKLARDQQRLERFQAEVRLTRQISHPNVCRVYDMDEVDGQQFLSMEFIDGEDLSILLRRIGRLPGDKGVQIAQQLCAGLAAAHDRGVLHRDLKPANIMLDGRGQVRITDFGLAKIVDEGVDREIAGTPAYMAPEQLRHGHTTIQSDLYSLGLILHELFTGEAVHKTGSIAELIQRHEDSSPSHPSSVVDDMDPVVERIILRCLEKQPHERPKSAHAVSAALPGGDPLEAALAARETPSPEMVAAAGGEGGLDPRIGVGLLAATALGLLCVWFLSGRFHPINRAGLEKHPEVLANDARNIIEAFGCDAEAFDTAWGLIPNSDYLRYLDENEASGESSRPSTDGQPPLVVFWYRHSPVPLKSERFFTDDGRLNYGYVSVEDPPATMSGMITVRLDPQGRLLEFLAVPPTDEAAPADGATEPDWLNLFDGRLEEILGFSLQSFADAESTWHPPTAFDTKRAWEGAYAGGIPIRVEAASYKGKPVYLSVIGPWTRTGRARTDEYTPVRRFRSVLQIVLIVSAILAVYNMRTGRGDRRGAFRLTLFALACSLLIYLFATDHLLSIMELEMFWRASAWSIEGAISMWLFYMALEPFVRRRWPRVLISWSRLLAGRLTDPLIGRHLLIGMLGGTFAVLLGATGAWTEELYGQSPAINAVSLENLEPILGPANLLARVVAVQLNAIDAGLTMVVLLLIAKTILRSNWLAAAAVVVLFVAIFSGFGEASVPAIVGLAVAFGTLVALAMRFGLLTYITAMFAVMVSGWPMTTDTSAWYFGTGIGVLAVLFAIACYGFYTSLGKRPVLGAA